MSDVYDIFFSYRRKDLDRAQPLLDALAAAGLRVWRDAAQLPDNAPITEEIRRGLAASKALIAFYSADYPLSRPCQQEITAAWTCAQAMGDVPYDRVLVANPEATFDHLPKVLAEQQSMGWAGDSGGFARLAEKIRLHIARFQTTLAAVRSPVIPNYHGMAAVSAPRFVGRVREMWELHGQLTANRMSIITGVSGQAAAQVRGLGGVGKSMLAREYAILFGAAYPGGVFWLNAYGNDDTKGQLDAVSREALRQDQIREFAVGLGVEVERRTPSDVESGFWRKLEQNGLACLWIVDDLPSGLKQGEIERVWTAQWGGASTLVTTRSAEYDAFGRQLNMDVLSEAESWNLLTGHLTPRGKTEEEAARGIAAELGNHPLAIEVAGSYLAKGIQSFRQYLDDLVNADEDALEFGAELRAVLPTGHERSIAGTLLKSIRLLGDEGMDFLRLASVLAVAAIPVRLVGVAFERLASDAGHRQRVVRALDQADSLGLCTQDTDGARIVHTLVSRTIRYHDSDRQRIGALSVAVTQALGSLLEAVVDIRSHADVAREVVHARHIVSGGVASAETADLALWVARHDYERGDYSSARKLEERVLEFRRRVLGEEHPATLTAMNNLAQTVQDLGDLAGARSLQEQVANASRQLFGEGHLATLTAMNNLAQIVQVQGDMAGARNLQQQVLKGFRQALGEEHPETLKAMNNLAQIFAGEGDLAGARMLNEQVLDTRRRMLGEQHPETLTAMNNLAATLQAQGDPGRARKLMEQVLEVRQHLLEKEHPGTLSAMNNLAETLRAQGDFAGARRLQEEVLQASLRLFGEQHPDTLTVMNNLAGTLEAQGDLSDALSLLERVLEASRRVLGEDHPDTLKAMNNVAAVLGAQGNVDQARTLQEHVLEIRRRVLGEAHPDTVAAMNNLAYTMRTQGELVGARKLQEKVLEASRRLLGDHHPNTLTAIDNLAQTIADQGGLAEAGKLLQQVLETSRRVLGQEHPHTLRAMNNAAATLRQQGRWPEARMLQEQVLEIRQRVLGKDHPDTLRAGLNLAGTAYAQQDLSRAREILENVLEAFRRVLGEQHPDTLRAMNNLAQVLEARGDLANARELMEEVLEGRHRLLGEAHPDTTIGAWNLLQTLSRVGDRNHAAAIRTRYLQWLVKADSASLADVQRQIRRMLME